MSDHDKEMLELFADRRRLNWMEQNLASLTQGILGIDVTGYDKRRITIFKAKSIREAIDKAMQTSTPESK